MWIAEEGMNPPLPEGWSEHTDGVRYIIVGKRMWRHLDLALDCHRAGWPPLLLLLINPQEHLRAPVRSVLQGPGGARQSRLSGAQPGGRSQLAAMLAL
jgi:hypothetical protein